MPKPETRAELTAKVADLVAIIEHKNGEIAGLHKRADEAAKSAAAVRQDNDLLRDQVHDLELRNARLEGQLERVRELEPIPHRELADIERQDVAESLEVQASRIRYPRRQATAGLVDGAAAAAPTPYYRRRF